MTVQLNYFPGVGYVGAEEYFALKKAGKSSATWSPSLAAEIFSPAGKEVEKLESDVKWTEIGLNILEKNGKSNAPWADDFLKYSRHLGAGNGNSMKGFSAAFDSDCVLDLYDLTVRKQSARAAA